MLTFNDEVTNVLCCFRNEEEIDLINQKCAEEVELYKVQLVNATRTIESLESKLNDYQIRRHDIAENLHSIMETQWKKTLEILTNPSKLKNYNELLSNEVSESDNNKQFQQAQSMNNLSRSEENLKADLLRNYIEMVCCIRAEDEELCLTFSTFQLLKQSPKSDQVTEESNSHERNSERNSHRGSSRLPKPWK